MCQHRPIVPGRVQPSIVGTNELNFRVRNGNGWTLAVIDTDFLFVGFRQCRRRQPIGCTEKE